MRRFPAGLFLCTATVLAAQAVPATLNYQGRLTDNSPSPVPITAVVPMRFALYDAPSGGTLLWQEPASGGLSVPVTGGIFSVALGGAVAIPPGVFSGATSSRYLEITLDPAGAAEVLAPRQLVSATAYANLAQNANSAVSADSATSAGNASNLGGVAAANYLQTTGTAFDSARLGGTLASGWQKALASPACPANQFLTGFAAGGGSSCAGALTAESDPKVGTLSDGRVPRWSAGPGSLVDGALSDNGAGSVALGVANPVAQFHVGVRLTLLGSSATGLNSPRSVFVQGRYAYVASYNNDSLVIFDLSNPAGPVFIGSTTSFLFRPYSVVVQGRYAYVVSLSGSSLTIFDVSNPAAPAQVGFITTGLSFPRFVDVQGSYAYVTSYANSSLVIFDVSNPANPVFAGSTTAGLSAPLGIDVQGRYAYVASGSLSALSIFDISDPANPVSVGATATGLSNPYAIYVQGRYAYATNWGNRTLSIHDISNPANPQLVSSTSLGIPLVPNTIFVQGRYAYLTGQNDLGVTVLDISAPASPQIVTFSVGALNTPYSLFVSGRTAYVANGGSNTLMSFDLGGAYLQQLEAGGIETGTLNALSNVQITGDAQVKGGLVVGAGGFFSAGDVGVSGRLRLTGGAPGAGKVLTSDAAGAASWQSLPAGNPGTVTAVSASGPLSVTNPTTTPNVALTGVVPLVSGGTGADLSVSGGAGQVLKQTGAGAAVSVAPLAAADIPNLDASKITSGILPVANGGTGSSTQNFVDLTTAQSVGGAKSFSGNLTVTAPATLSVGVRYVTCTVSTATQACACAAGETVVAGGAQAAAGNAVRESRPTSATTWQVTCITGAGTNALCAAMNILCDRRAP